MVKSSTWVRKKKQYFSGSDLACPNHSGDIIATSVAFPKNDRSLTQYILRLSRCLLSVVTPLCAFGALEKVRNSTFRALKIGTDPVHGLIMGNQPSYQMCHFGISMIRQWLVGEIHGFWRSKKVITRSKISYVALRNLDFHYRVAIQDILEKLLRFRKFWQIYHPTDFWIFLLHDDFFHHR